MSTLSLIKKGPSFPVLGFDIENRPLAYWFDGQATAQITAIAWKERQEKTCHVMLLTADDRWIVDDKRKKVTTRDAVQMFAEILCEAGLVYGHNIRNHDLPIFNAALERELLPVLPSILTCDTCKDYPKAKGKSKNLETLAAEHGLEGEKKHMGIYQWELSNKLLPDALSETVERVVGDVLLQEALRDKLLAKGYLSDPKRWSGRRAA